MIDAEKESANHYAWIAHLVARPAVKKGGGGQAEGYGLAVSFSK